MSEVIIKTLWVYGLTIIVSLGVAVIIKVIVLTLGRLEGKPAPPPLPVSPLPPAIDAHHVAAIAAAVHAMGGMHRIVHIETAHRHQEWTAGGRQAQHASHDPLHHARH